MGFSLEQMIFDLEELIALETQPSRHMREIKERLDWWKQYAKTAGILMPNVQIGGQPASGPAPIECGVRGLHDESCEVLRGGDCSCVRTNPNLTEKAKIDFQNYDKRSVLFLIPPSITEGNIVWKGTFSFQHGNLLTALLDVTLHLTDEVTVDSRAIKLEKGQELWVVTRRTEEYTTSIERHSDSPSIKVTGSR